MTREIKAVLKLLLVLLILTLVLAGVLALVQKSSRKTVMQNPTAKEVLAEIKEHPYAGVSFADWVKPEITEDFLPINEYSRCGEKLTKVNAIIIHYVGNPGTTGAQNRSYFEEIATTHEASRSSHFVIGLDGEIIQCMPLDEVSFASNERNHDTISIECCHPDKTGDFTKATYDSLVKLCIYLMAEFDLDTDSVLRHYDVTGKHCPKYFVEVDGSWDDFLFRMDRDIIDLRNKWSKYNE